MRRDVFEPCVHSPFSTRTYGLLLYVTGDTFACGEDIVTEEDTNEGIASMLILSVVVDEEYDADSTSRRPLIFENATLAVDVGQVEGNRTLDEFEPSM